MNLMYTDLDRKCQYDSREFFNFDLATPFRVLFAFPQLLAWVWDVAIRAAQISFNSEFEQLWLKVCQHQVLLLLLHTQACYARVQEALPCQVH